MGWEMLGISGVAIIGIYLAALLQSSGAAVASQHLSLLLGAVVLGGALGLLLFAK